MIVYEILQDGVALVKEGAVFLEGGEIIRKLSREENLGRGLYSAFFVPYIICRESRLLIVND